MNTFDGSYPRIKNRILATLPPAEYERLSPHFEHVRLSHGQVIIEHGAPIRDVYFPNEALVSLVMLLSDGSTLQAGVVGREGMAGLPVVLGADSTAMRSVVQIPGTAVKVKAKIIRDAFNREGALQARLLAYAHALLIETAQFLREAGAINYNRGHVQILDREGLKTLSCECYGAVKDQFELLLSVGNNRPSVTQQAIL